MNISSIFWWLCAIAVTVGALIDTWSNVEAIGGAGDVRAYVAAVSIIGLFAGFAAPVVRQTDKLAGTLLYLGWACSLAFTLGASIDRVSGAKNDRVSASASINAQITRLDQRIADLTAKRNEEAGRRGCGRICRQWQDKLDRAHAERRTLGVTKETDSGAATVSYLTRGYIGKQDWGVIQPALGPIALIVLVNAFSMALGSMYSGYRQNVSRETKRLEAAPTKAEVAENVYSFAQRFEQKNGRKLTLPEGEKAFPDIPRTSVYRYMNGDIPGKKPRKPRATRKLVAAG